MTGTGIVLVMGAAVLIGGAIGELIGRVLDKIGQRGGRHRTRKRVVRSGLVMMLPLCMFLAAGLPVPADDRPVDVHRAVEIGAALGGAR